MNFEEISTTDYLRNINDFGATLDVRSPSEFAESHIPNAVNLYALSDEERVEVGTIHKRSSFEAKLLGASLVCKNLAFHIPNLYPNYTPAHKIAIYCARGQMRSGSVAIVLSHIGYRIYRIKGGYKSYRAEVLRFFDNLPKQRFLVIDGLTGSGKSDIISSVDWSLDLEKFAGHKGSVFGGVGVVQQNQKAFENQIMHTLLYADQTKPILIESESKNIGKVTIPTALHDQMLDSVRIYLVAPLDQRIARIVKEYGLITADQFEKAMSRIAPFMKTTIKDEIKASFYAGNLARTAEILLVEYYDKVYKKHPRNEYIVEFTTLDETIRKIEEIGKSLA